MRTRRDRELTALQRRALECVRGAGAKGVNLSAYCRSRGVAVRQVYDALIPLRRRGLLPAKLPLKLARSPKSSGSADAFMTVQIASPAVPVSARQPAHVAEEGGVEGSAPPYPRTPAPARH